ncbi:MAG TPA: LD-carboxypeptidase [Egibacteraceae bacterium]|nr:LD-carboxypeptidase [Egibacteraceae bacterium]
MPRTKPPRLRAGATFGVVASSSPVFEQTTARRGVRRLEQAGYRVRFLPHARDRIGYLAGSAADRAADLHAAFADPAIDAVLQLRGGYGAGQLLPLLDVDLLRANPKPFVGFSDTTMLHVALGQRAGLVTFWGPALAALGRASAYTWERFVHALTAPTTPSTVGPHPDDPWVATLTGGMAEGDLVGGTTSLLAATLGTPWEIDTAGRILLLEDVNEEPYRVDRLLTQLAQAGKLAAAAGIVVAEHAGVRPRGSFPGGSLSLDDVLDALVRPLGVPAVHGLPLGHGRHLATVPLGVAARLDADAGRLTILDPGLV